MLAPYGADAMVLRAAAALEQRLALPKGIAEPRRGTAELRTQGPRRGDGDGEKGREGKKGEGRSRR